MDELDNYTNHKFILDETLDAVISPYCHGNANISEAVEKIKQTFTDAGWVNTKAPITGNIHGVGVYEIGPKLFAVNGVDELVTHDRTRIKLDPAEPARLTGQEWYDRFEKETNELKFKPNKLVEAYKEQGLEEQARELAAVQMADAIMGAAKKASGIA